MCVPTRARSTAVFLALLFASGLTGGFAMNEAPWRMMSPGTAHAATAVFATPTNGNPGSLAGTADGTGVLVAPGQTVGLLLSSPFGLLNGFTPLNNNVSIFTLSDIGSALGQISFGRYNDGNPTVFHTQNFSTGTNGTEIDFGFLSWVGCGVSGGCDYIRITALDAYNGSAGIVFDAVEFSGVALSSVTGAAPEPAVWMLMIMGFAFIAGRMKQTRSHHIKPVILPSPRQLPGTVPFAPLAI